MVHKKFITVNGKRYGPYLYTNKRVGQKIVTTYVGKNDTGKKPLLHFVLLAIFGVFLVGGLVYLLQGSVTGRASLDIEKTTYTLGETVQGLLRMQMRAGELIPEDSTMLVTLGNQSISLPLAQLISLPTSEGSFYAEGSDIQGSGTGYGTPGNIINSYPTITFNLKVSPSLYNPDNNQSLSNETITPDNNETIPVSPNPDNNASETTPEPSSTEPSVSPTPEPTPEPVVSPTPTEPSTTPSESPAHSDSGSSGGSEGSSDSDSSGGDSGAAITGGVISEDGFIVSGATSANQTFEYTLGEGEGAALIDGSVKVNGEPLSNDKVHVSIVDGKVIVSTDYASKEEGFGAAYVGDYVSNMSIDLSAFGVSAEEGTLTISLIYGNTTLASASKTISIIDNKTIANETGILLLKNIPDMKITKNGQATIDLNTYFSGATSYEFVTEDIVSNQTDNFMTLTPDTDFLGERIAHIIATNANGTLQSNDFTILVASSSLSIQTLRDKIVVNEPVHWVKNISLDAGENVSIDLPAGAENITVQNRDTQIAQPIEVPVISLPTETNASPESSENTSLPVVDESPAPSAKSITGQVIGEEVKNETANESIPSESATTPISISLDEGATQYTIDYYTAAPTIAEEPIAEGRAKIITVSGPELNYTDIIAFIALNNSISILNEGKIRLYWFNREPARINSSDLKGIGDVENQTLIDTTDNEGNIVPADTSENLSDANVSSPFTGNVIIDDFSQENTSLETNSSLDNITLNYSLDLVPFESFDEDLDGMIDKIGWVVPHLSNQTFQLEFSIQSTPGNLTNCTIIDTAGNYTINVTLAVVASSGTCFNITASNVALDGRGFNITKTTGGGIISGITANNVQNLTIRNLNFRNFTNGVFFSFVNRSNILNNTFEGNISSLNGVFILGSSNITIANNNITKVRAGITLNFSTQVNVSTNILTTIISTGIGFSSSNNVTAWNNTLRAIGIALEFDENSTNVFTSQSIIDNSTNGFASVGAVGVYTGTDIYVLNTLINRSLASAIVVDQGLAVNNLTFDNVSVVNTSNAFFDFDIHQGQNSRNVTFIDTILNNWSVSGAGGNKNYLSVIDRRFGRIEFNAALGATTSGNFSNVISIYQNVAHVNGADPVLNKSANVTLYNIASSSNNTIFRDGVQCPSTVCQNFTSLNNGGNLSFNVTGWSQNYTIVGTNPSSQNLTGCTVLTSAGLYTLNKGLGSSGTCIGISANNVVLDCLGFNISYGNATGTSNGVTINGTGTLSNITIRNCKIFRAGSTGGSNYGVQILTSENSTIYNNTIITTGLGSNNYGLYISSGKNINVSYNNISTNGTSGNDAIFIDASTNNTIYLNNLSTFGNSVAGGNPGLLLQASSNNTISYNTILANGVSGNRGIYLNNNCQKNNISSNNVYTSGNSSANDGIYLDTGNHDNIIYANIISTNGTNNNNGIYLSDSSNNTIQSNQINTSGPISSAFFVSSTVNNTFINNTLLSVNGSDIYFITQDNNGTVFVDQILRNYTILNLGGKYTFRDTNEGEIKFLRNMNGSGGNLSNEITISPNFAHVNGSNPGLNVSANVTLYNINSSTNNSIYSGNVLCPSTVCQNLTSLNNGGNITFNVTSWVQNYSIIDATFLISSCQSIGVSGTYILTNSIQSNTTCITITADNVTLDGQGFNITSMTGTAGTYAVRSTGINFTVKNIIVFYFAEGIRLENNVSYILNITSKNNTQYGIHYFNGASNGTIINTTIINSFSHGVYYQFGGNNTATNVMAVNNSGGAGFEISSSDKNVLTNVTANSNSRGVSIDIGNENIITNGTLNDNIQGGISFGNGQCNLNIFNNIVINASRKYAITLSGAGSSTTFNNFTNITLSNTNASWAEVQIDEGYSARFIDTQIGNYSISALNKDLVLKNSLYGQVLFSKKINATGQNLSGDIQIFSNSIFVNSSKSTLNKSATVDLYNVPTNLTTPALYRDGVLCPDSVCTNTTNLTSGNISFTVTGWSTYSLSEALNLTGCGVITTPGIFALTQNLTTTGTCFTVRTSNVTIDGKGFSISGDRGSGDYGINATTPILNLTIINLTVSAFEHGIKFNGVNNSQILYSNIVNNSNNGIYFESSCFFNVIANSTSTNNTVYGINIVTSGNNTIMNNLIKNNSDNNIILQNSPIGNTIINNVIGTGGQSGISLSNSNSSIITNNSVSNNIYGFQVFLSSNNMFFNNTAISSLASGLFIYGNSQSNIFSVMNITNSGQNSITIGNGASSAGSLNNNLSSIVVTGTGAGFNDIFFGTSGNNNTYIIDSTFGQYNFTGNGSEGNIIYFKNSSYGQIRFLSIINASGANLSADIIIRNNFASINASKSGLNKSANITFFNMPNYFNGSILRDGAVCPAAVCQNFSALTGNITFNVTGWSNYSIGFGNVPPTQGVPFLNTTSTVSNSTTQNLTLYPRNITDADSDAVKNVTDWQIGGVSIALLNLPFEGGSKNQSAGGPGISIKDYSTFSNNISGLANLTWNSTGGHDGMGGYMFNGYSNYMREDLFNATKIQNITIAAWIYERNNTGSHVIVAMEPRGANLGGGNAALGVIFYTGGSGLLGVQIGNGTGGFEIFNGSTTVTTNTWHHVAFTYNQSKVSLYLDGALEYNRSKTEIINWTDFPAGTNFPDPAQIYVGAFKGNTVGAGATSPDLTFFNGSIDDIQIYNRTLSAQQIKFLFQNRTDIIASQELILGQNWSACVTPSDKFQDGATICSNTITITNNAPTQNTPYLNTTNVGFNGNGTNQNLTLYIQNLTDLDGDMIKNITDWRVNGNSTAVLNMPFEGGSNTSFTKDYSSFNNNGTVLNFTQWSPTGGYDGKGAYVFNGINQSIKMNLTNSLNITGNITVSFKVYHNSGQVTSIIHKENHFSVEVNASGAIFWADNSNSTNWCYSCFGGYGNLPLNSWQQIVVTRSGSNVTIYMNNTVVISRAYGIGGELVQNSTTQLFLGCYGGGLGTGTFCQSQFLDGRLDDVQIYNRALSPQEVNLLYQNRTDTIASQELRAGENWSACVTPNDGVVDGATKCSNNVTITNVVSATDCGNISSPGTYMLSQNLISNGTCFTIRSSNVTVDCNGQTILYGNTTTGNAFNVSANLSMVNINIMNCIISKGKGGGTNNYGINFRNVSNSSVLYSNITTNGTITNYGINIDQLSNSITIAYNNITSTGTSAGNDGIVLSNSIYGTNITGNVISANSLSTARAITFNNANNNLIVNNNITALSGGDAGEGLHIVNSGSGNNVTGNIFNINGTTNILGISTSGTANTNMIAYNLFNVSGGGTNGGSFGIFFGGTANSNNITGNLIATSGNVTAIGLEFQTSCNDNLIFYNNISTNTRSTLGFTGNTAGIYLTNGISGTNVTGNVISTNGFSPFNFGIFLTVNSVNNNNIINNNITTNGTGNAIGIYLFDRVSNNNITGNIINTLGTSTTTSGGNAGIRIETASHNNIFTNNNITTGGNVSGNYGIYIIGNSTNNTFSRISVNNTGGDAIRIIGSPDSFNNTFSSISIVNTNLSYYDLFLGASMNGTYLIDTQINNYSINGTGSLVYFQKTDAGQIFFLKAINASGTNLSADVFLANNSMFVNSSRVGLNISANITFYGISTTINNPIMRRDNIRCPSNVCTNFTSLLAGTVRMNVTGWSTYSIGQNNTVINISSIILNTTNPTTNNTDTNLTLNLAITNPDGDPYKNITNWYVNNQSIMLVNMPFEGGSSSIYTKDYAGLIANGTPAGGATWNATEGHDGKGAYHIWYNASHVEVGTPGMLNLTKDFTISIWFKERNVDGSSIILAKRPTNNDANYVFIISGTGSSCVLDLQYANPPGTFRDLAGTTTFSEGIWHHAVVTHNDTNNTIRFYIDGVPDASNPIVTPAEFLGDNGTLWLGLQNEQSPNTGFNGTLDDLQIYNRTLSPQQVKALYQNRTDLILAPETNKWENWSACVTPNDGVTDAGMRCSNNVTILNSLTTQNTPILNATNVNNKTNQNLTLNIINVSDLDGDKVKNITDWRVGGASIAPLNLPFEAGSNGSFTKDYSTFSNNISSIQEAVWNATGGYDGKGAYQFDGINDLLDVGLPASLDMSNQNFSISLWYKRVGDSSSAFPNVGALIRNSRTVLDGGSSGQGWALGLENSASHTIRWDIGNGSTGLQIVNISMGSNNGQWYHVVVVRDNGNCNNSIYQNGVLINATIAVCGDIFNGAGSINIGYDNAYQFNGTIDDVQIYNRSLSAQQIQALYLNRTNLMVSQELQAGQNWSACVTPNDGEKDGATSCSNNVTIITSSSPTMTSILLNATDNPLNSTDANLTLFIRGSDADGDTYKNITDWRISGKSIAFWNLPFEGGSNSSFTKDYSTFSVNGSVLNGAAWNATGGHDNFGAYEFDGVNDRIEANANSFDNFTGNVTFSAWVKMRQTTTTYGAVIVGQSYPSYGTPDPGMKGLQLALADTGTPYFKVYGIGASFSAQSAGALSTNTWYHLVGTVNTTTAVLYINGAQDQLVSVANRTNTSEIYIGGENYLGLAEFNGTIDDVQIFNRTLTAQQIQALYQNKTNIIAASETVKGQNWSACVTGNDGTSDGPVFCSNNLTILNAAPTQNTPYLNTTDVDLNDTTQNLTLYIQNVSDLDNDLVKNITDWRMNSTSIAVLNMPFEGGSNSSLTKDYSTFSNNGSVFNGATYNATGGYDGKGAYQFDGVNGYINITNSLPLNISKNITINAWVKLASSNVANYPMIVSKGVNIGYILYINNNGLPIFAIGNTGNAALLATGTTNISANVGKWYHVAGTYDNQNIRIYVNGLQEGFTAQTADIGLTNLPVHIGSDEGGTGNNFNGTIDDVQIYNRSLSGQEVALLYQNRTDLIAAQELAAGQNWSACVTPNDGEADGATKCSNNVTIIGSTSFSGCFNITGAGTYTLSQNVVSPGTCMFVRASKSTLDCQGFNITYSNTTISGIGINVTATTFLNKVTIKNCVVIEGNGNGTLNYGIYLRNVSNSTVLNNIVKTRGNGTDNYGIYVLGNSLSNTLLNNTITTNGTGSDYGIRVDSGSHNTTIQSNNISAFSYATTGTSGISLSASVNTSILYNIISADSNGTSTVYGVHASASSNNTYIQSNNISANGVNSIRGIYFTASPSGAAKNNSIFVNASNPVGILLDTASSNITISDNIVSVNASASNVGIGVASSINTTIKSNTVLLSKCGFSTDYGIRFETSANNTLVDSNIVNINCNINAVEGISVFSSNNNTIQSNNLSVNGTTVVYGIHLTTGSSNNLVQSNVMSVNSSGNNVGIRVFSSSSNNTVKSNRVSTGVNNGNRDIEVTQNSSNNILQYNILSIGGTTNSDNIGILVSLGSNSTVIDSNNISVTGTTAVYGIQLTSESSNTTVQSNRISANGSLFGNIGIVVSSYQNSITNNTIITNGTSGDHGMQLTSAGNNIIWANIINTTGTSSNAFVIDLNASFTTLINNTLGNITGNDLNLTSQDTNGTVLVDQIIRGYGFNGTGSKIIFRLTNLSEIGFLQSINGSGSNLSAEIILGNNSVFVNGTNTKLNKTANITFYNLPAFAVPKIRRNGILCPAGICTNITNLTSSTVLFNVTGWSNYSIGESNNAPTLSSAILNATDKPANGTDANLTLYLQGSDNDGDAYVNITDWRRNGISLAVLILPFEGGSRNGTATGLENATRDYSMYSHNATANNATFNSSGGHDNFGAYEFNKNDRNDTFLQVPFVTGSMTNVTLTFWFKHNSTDNVNLKGMVWRATNTGPGAREFGCDIDDSVNRVTCSTGNSSTNIQEASPVNSVTDNRWHFASLSLTNSTINQYIDGVNVANENFSGGRTTFASQEVVIGSETSSQSSARMFKGAIDDVIVWNTTLSDQQILLLNSSQNQLLGSQQTTKKENWSVCATLNDRTSDSATVCSNNVTIQNSLPNVTLILIADANTTTNRTPQFTWNATDPDGDTLTYNFNLSLIATSLCTDTDRWVRGISTTFYNTAAPDLKCLYDNGDYYNWSVQANDGDGNGSFAGYRKVNISALLAITLLNRSVDFGTVSITSTNDTTTDSPLALLLQNDGNCFANITINATDLWGTVANPSQYYQFKIRNYSLENNSFNNVNSIMSFTNMTPNGTVAISHLNYSDASDSAKIDIRIQVPPNELGGFRNSTVTFRATRDE